METEQCPLPLQDTPVADAKPDDIKDLLGGALFRALYKWMEETGPVYLLPTGRTNSLYNHNPAVGSSLHGVGTAFDHAYILYLFRNPMPYLSSPSASLQAMSVTESAASPRAFCKMNQQCRVVGTAGSNSESAKTAVRQSHRLAAKLLHPG